jgi:hypothetical protein
MLIVSTLGLSWLGMMVVHEFGHATVAWLTGGSVARVELGPLEFSRTELRTNPHPLAVAWGGPLVGSSLPLALSLSWRLKRWPGWYLLQFFAGLCLVTNGIYLAVVSFIKNAADPGDLMREGSPQWLLVAFGVIAFPLGLALWNGLGPHFGLGAAQGRVNHATAIGTFLSLCLLVLVELLTYAG